MQPSVTVKILRDTVADVLKGDEYVAMPVAANSVQVLAERSARILVGMSKAEPYSAEAGERSVSRFKDKHKGKVIAILGGGPSLPDDLKKLPKGCITIAVNHHAQKIIACDYMAFLDDPNRSPHLKAGCDATTAIKVSPRAAFTDIVIDCEYDDPGFTSGFALWFARHLGAKMVITCGMDCYTGSRRFFHDDEPDVRYGDQVQGHLAAWGKVAERNPVPIKAASGPLVEIFGEYKRPARRKRSRSK